MVFLIWIHLGINFFFLYEKTILLTLPKWLEDHLSFLALTKGLKYYFFRLALPKWLKYYFFFIDLIWHLNLLNLFNLCK